MKMGCCLGRYSSGAEDSEELENQICIGKNRPLHQDRLKWTSECPMTEGQLRSKRDEFWETAPAFEGRKEIWDALRAAATHAEQHDFALAQAIVDGANITLPTGTLTETYDELGNRYQIPIYCLFCPTNMAEERSESSYGSMRETYSTDSLAVGCHGNSAATVAPPPTDAFPVLFRLSDSPTTSADLELLVRPKETIFHLKQRLFLANQRKKALVNPLINETPPAVVVSPTIAHEANSKTYKTAEKTTVSQTAGPHSMKKVIENGHVNKRAISGLGSSSSTKKNFCGPMSVEGAVGNHSRIIKYLQTDELNTNDVVVNDHGAGPDIKSATVVPAPRAQKWYFGGRLLTDKMRVDQTALEPYFVVQVVVVNAEDQLSSARTVPDALTDRLVGEVDSRAQSTGSTSSIHSPLVGLGCTEHAKTTKMSKRKKSSVSCHSGCGSSPTPNCPLCKSSQCAQCKPCHKLMDRTDDVSEKSACRHNAGDSDSGEVAHGLLKGRRHKHRHHHHHCHKGKQRSHEHRCKKEVASSTVSQGTTCQVNMSDKPTSGNRCCGASSIPGMICTGAGVDSNCITVIAANEASASGDDKTSPLFPKTMANFGGCFVPHNMNPNSSRSDCCDVKVENDFSGVDLQNNAMWDESVVSAHFDGLWPASKLNGIKDLILEPTTEPAETCIPLISSEVCHDLPVAGRHNQKFVVDDSSFNSGVIEDSFSNDRKLSSLITRNVSDSPVSSVSASKILATITNSSPAVTLKMADDTTGDVHEPLLCQNIDDGRDEKAVEYESVPPFSTTGLNSRKLSISLTPVE